MNLELTMNDVLTLMAFAVAWYALLEVKLERKAKLRVIKEHYSPVEEAMTHEPLFQESDSEEPESYEDRLKKLNEAFDSAAGLYP